MNFDQLTRLAIAAAISGCLASAAFAQSNDGNSTDDGSAMANEGSVASASTDNTDNSDTVEDADSSDNSNNSENNDATADNSSASASGSWASRRVGGAMGGGYRSLRTAEGARRVIRSSSDESRRLCSFAT